MNHMIVEQDYWERSYENYKFHRLPKLDPTLKLIEKFIPEANNNEQAFELGCFPGRFLVEIGQKGYMLNGCDLAPQVSTVLKEWCLKNNCKVNHFYNASYLDFIASKYDLVASFGFIEHFENFEEIFLQQCNMVDDGGILFVQFPNFRGFIQKYLHKWFDRDNLNNHVIPSMDIQRYKYILPSEFEVIYCDYYGNFDFWIDDYMHRNGKVKTKFLSLFFRTSRFWKFLPNSSVYSPYAALIARKKTS